MKSIICFAPVILYFANYEKKTLSRFAIVDNMPDLLDMLQLLIDSSTGGLADVIGQDTLSGRYFKTEPLAARHGMRKRSFDERINDVKTYKLEE